MKTTPYTNHKAHAHRSGYTLVEIMIVVSLIGLLTGIAVPNFLKSREASQLSGIVNNIRIIENAKDEWALQTHKGAGDTADWSDLSDYLKGGTVKLVASETYTINPISTNAYALASVKLGPFNAGTPITPQ